MNILNVIENKILSSLDIILIDVIDQSDLHRGHKFVSISPISHIKIFLVSDDFSTLNLISRHRMLNNLLKEEIILVHSITFSLYTVGEYLLRSISN